MMFFKIKNYYVDFKHESPETHRMGPAKRSNDFRIIPKKLTTILRKNILLLPSALNSIYLSTFFSFFNNVPSSCF
jgi:hypothetical protein